MAAKSKPGPKPKAGERYPSGRLKPEWNRGSGSPPAQIRRMVALARNKAADPVLATAIGWLHLHSILTVRQLAAAEAYGKLRGQLDRAIGMPKRSSASPSYEGGYGRSGAAPMHDDDVKSIRGRHDVLMDVIKPQLVTKDRNNIRDTMREGQRTFRGHQRRDLLDRVIILDEHPSAWELETLISSLDRIALHLRLTI